MSLSVALIGATGYTGLEVAKLLSVHPQARLTIATARADAGQPIASVHPSLVGRVDLVLEELDADKIASRCDVAMCCLPHGASAETVRGLCAAGVRVIDFSADFRLSSLDVYEHWYKVKHPWPERVGQTVYGLPEFFADEIAKADLVANPGCYPTSAILPLAPLAKAGLIETDDIIVDSKSGVSGAGRGLKLGTLYCETNESIAAYAVGSHRHGPEIDDLVGRIGGIDPQVIFTPHLTPMSRGILSTIYVRPKSDDVVGAVKQVTQCWRDCYGEQPFVNVVDHLPATAHVAGTNYVQMAARASGKRIVLLSAIDNLAKGASGAAIQNMNVMFGIDQQVGLN
ncbi:N-acetyl-gamma-glutamyl-phosphate reductase [Roseiconus lacunae]|uniref:N-acetyl-gamma-glutamyl-phosphate reductase n=1 Tax=Roseiconus lacunae TaxID=2605694 RepID=A0ABT7PGC4_9BACT|nr:N-acetyl-gamma-glutamyl-phosphate reductase [Roseiconus lacunae]MCD0460425.1 N-acetyl-gamma-glutamyl-phosphate reductase [Roseiconus lacunae]MDM4015528.1 N-acetyl-gamma-glutamyl-phosphate reductase [Roseiconus lacunae]WRQ52795.1 N-acetyl-gamma-glutamyl-phosphate reductase [Stieleria sp. HD01]